MPKGLDVGTCFLVGASFTDNSEMAGVSVRPVRNAFLDMDNDSNIQMMLRNKKASYVERGDMLYLVGDAALQFANLMKRDVRRPLARGVISAGEKEAEKILYMLIDQVLGKPNQDGEPCFYSIPAAPVDVPGSDVTYHEAIFRKILTQQGYAATPVNEAAAIVYSNCADEDFTAMATSFGAGMVNTALVYNTLVGMQFSVARGGDYIDEQAAKAVGSRASNLMTIKEKGVNLMDPTEGDPKYLREREAIIVYYKNLIRYVVDSIKKEFRKSQGSIQFTDPIPWVLSGGTTKPKNFLELFKDEFSKVQDFPIDIKEIRMAQDPLNDVARGLLYMAHNSVD